MDYNKNRMAVVIPWTGSQKLSEAEIRRKLADEGLNAYEWSNGPYDVYAPHSHTYGKVLYVVSGSINFELTRTGERVRLAEGDRLELPADIMHGAVVGERGVVCLEAHR